MPSNRPPVQRISNRVVIRNLVIELSVYGILVTVYALLVLRWLSEPLQALFHGNLTLYAVVGLALIVAQGVLLERLTSFLLSRLGMKQVE